MIDLEPPFRRARPEDAPVLAERLAKDQGAKGVSIIVSDANSGAPRPARRYGYRETAKRPMVKEGWENPGEDWLFLVKSL